MCPNDNREVLVCTLESKIEEQAHSPFFQKLTLTYYEKKCLANMGIDVADVS